MGAMWSLFLLAVRQTLLARKVVLAVLMLCGPSVIVVLVRIFAPTPSDSPPWERYQGSMLYGLLGAVAPLVCMIYGPALIGAEVEAGTAVYLFTRRLRRATVVIVRYLGVAVGISLLLETALLACHWCNVAGLPAAQVAAAWTHASPTRNLLGYLAVAPAAVAAFLAIFAAINLVTAKALVFSGLYFVIVELTISHVPAAVCVYTVTHQVHKTAATLLPELREMLPMPREVLNEYYPPGESGGWALLGVAAAFVAFGCLLVSVREMLPERTARE